MHLGCNEQRHFVVLYCTFRSLAFFFIGFLNKAAKHFIYNYPPKRSQRQVFLPEIEALKPYCKPCSLNPKPYTLNLKP